MYVCMYVCVYVHLYIHCSNMRVCVDKYVQNMYSRVSIIRTINIIIQTSHMIVLLGYIMNICFIRVFAVSLVKLTVVFGCFNKQCLILHTV